MASTPAASELYSKRFVSVTLNEFGIATYHNPRYQQRFNEFDQAIGRERSVERCESG